MKELLKSLFGKLLAEYSIYWIYQYPGPNNQASASPAEIMGQSIRRLTPEDVTNSASEVIRDQAGFLGEEAIAYGFIEGEDITAICVFWYAQRYAKRNFWPLKSGEAKLVQIITDPNFRGKGAATRLISAASASLLSGDFTTLYARVWHSNTPSIKAFERADWKRKALALELKPFKNKRGIKVFIPWKNSPA